MIKKQKVLQVGIEKSVQDALDDKKEKIKDELKNELATKEFVRAEVAELKAEFC